MDKAQARVLGLAAAVSLAASCAAATAAYKEVTVKDGGTLAGSVRWVGEIPKPVQVKPTTHTKVCHAHPDRTLTVDEKTRGIRYTIVALVGIAEGKKFEKRDCVIEQKGCSFQPHIAVAGVGGTVTIRNTDPVLHNVHTSARRNPSINEAAPAGAKPLKWKPSRPECVALKCDVHSWMQGYILVTEHPYVAVTDANGKFTIRDIPPGRYRVAIWHENRRRMKFSKTKFEVTIEAGKTARIDLTAEKKTRGKKKSRRSRKASGG